MSDNEKWEAALGKRADVSLLLFGTYWRHKKQDSIYRIISLSIGQGELIDYQIMVNYKNIHGPNSTILVTREISEFLDRFEETDYSD